MVSGFDIIGWVTYEGNVCFAKFDLEDRAIVILYKSDQNTKIKTKIRIDNYNIIPIHDKSKGKGLTFYLYWGKNSLQFNEIMALEKWALGNKEDKLLLISYESRIVKLISQYTSKPAPVVYQFHAHHYETLKEEEVQVSRPISTKIRETIRETAQKPNTTISTIGLVMDNFTDVVGEIDKLSDRVDRIESLQEKMANIIDVVSTHVGIGDSGTNAPVGVSQMEMVNALMEKVDSIEGRLESIAPGEPGTNLEDRVTEIEKKLGVYEEDIDKRLVNLEGHKITS